MRLEVHSINRMIPNYQVGVCRPVGAEESHGHELLADHAQFLEVLGLLGVADGLKAMTVGYSLCI